MFNLASKARPYFGAVVLTTSLLTAGGIYSATRMPSGVYPEVTFPRIAVVAKKPGLDLRSMELQVTVPLEQAVSTVIGVVQVRSKTIRGGCDISVEFAPGSDMHRAEQLTWNRIGAARSQLPPDVALEVEQMTPSVFPILSVVLTGGESPAQLWDYAYYELAPRMKNIPDVYRVNVAGGDQREIEVEARPDDLLAAGLSAADLADQIGKLHRLQPVGRIEQEPFAFQIIVNTQGETARQIEELVISTRNNQPLRVRDVADVRVLHQDRVRSVGFDAKDAVVLTVFRRLKGNTVNISDDVRALLAQQPPPGNIRATMAYDQARFINTAIHNVRDAILIGGLFSILILLAFLRSWRATLISALAIPTTLAITFLFLYWSGETLNLMSLGGLAVAIGLIIDDTVVVIENIARHLARNPKSEIRNPKSEQAAQPLQHSAKDLPTSDFGFRISDLDPVDAAASEITGAVVGSTLTTVLVFVPLAFIVGVYGQFFASLAWSLTIAVLVSMVISLTVVPVFAAKFLAGRPMPGPGPIYRFVAHIYEIMLGGALRFPWATLAFSVGAMALGVLLFFGLADLTKPLPEPPAGAPPSKWDRAVAYLTAERRDDKGKPLPPWVQPLQTGLMPAMDEGAFVFDYYAPMGTPLQRTEEIAKQLEEILLENPDIQAYARRTGTQLGMFATKTNRGDIQVVLRPAEDDPVSLLTKPVRPKFGDIEKEMKQAGEERAKQKYGPKPTEAQVREQGKAMIRERYRRRPLKDVMDEIEDEVKEHYSEHQLSFELIQIMKDELDDLTGANRSLEVKLFGPDYQELRELAERVKDKLEKNGKDRGIKEVNSYVFAGNPDLMLEVDGARAARLGLTPDEVERQLRAMYLGQIATQVRESALRITDVRVRYPDAARYGPGGFDPNRILNQLILLPPAASPGTVGLATLTPLAGPARAVPLGTVAQLKRLRTPDEQSRENQQPAIFVTAEHDEAKAGLGAAVDIIRRSMDELGQEGKIPPGYRWEVAGHYQQLQKATQSFVVVLVVAVLLVFIMLAFQFRSVVLPLLIFLTQPLSLVSGLFALWLTNTPLNVSSGMGLILLIGLDMKNGILLVEYIQQLRKEGMELRPALLLAGRTRFRPILMTSLAAVLGLFPLALGIGPGAQMQQPLAIVVIGGLTANMLFTRIIIPVGYLVLERRPSALAAAR